MSPSSRRRPKAWYQRITKDQIRMTALGLFVLVLLLFGWQALRATSSLRLAASQAELLQNQVIAGDDVQGRSTLAALQESTERARSTTDGPLWDIGSKIPFLGKNIKAVQVVSAVMSQVSNDALPPIVNLSAKINLNTFSPQDGKIDLPAIQAVAPSITKAATALESARRELQPVDAESLLVPLRGPVSTVQTKLDNASSAASNSNLAAELLPSMLGGQQTRRYMLLIQNNAESRATGGIAGSFAILTAKKGKLSMGFQGSFADLAQFKKPVVPMTQDELSLYPPTLVTNLLDTNTTPDFPRTAQIVRAMVAQGRDVDVDGVISVDPIAMSYILAGTGAVPTGVPGLSFDQTNAVDLLLNTIYLRLNATAQDETFKTAARGVFDVVSAGTGDPRLVLQGLVKGVADNRVMVWSKHPDEQKLLQPSELSGQFSGNDGATPHVGMYLGDAASGKMEYYLDYSTIVTARRCLPGKIQELTSTTRLTSNAPADAAKLPRLLAGDGTYTPRGTMRLVARFYSPYAGGFTEVLLDGKPQAISADTLRGRSATRVLLTLKPGETHTITTTMITGKGQDKDGVFSSTPGVRTTGNDVPITSACS